MVDINSPAFRRWFDGSKVVDSGGQPLVVWHFSKSHQAFDVFDFGRARDVGFHFGTRGAAQDMARQLRGQTGTTSQPEPYYLRCLNPLGPVEDTCNWVLGRGYLWSPGSPLLDEMRSIGAISQAEHAADAAAIKKIDIGIRASGISDPADAVFRREAGAIVRNRMLAAGFDGFLYLNEFEDPSAREVSWCVLSPSQIKSAESNDGTFDLDDPSVRSNPRRW